MRPWTTSAGLALALTTLAAAPVAAAHSGPVHPAGASARTAISAEPALARPPGATAAPVPRGTPASEDMPGWLKTMLLDLGMLTVAAFIAELALGARRRRGASGALPSHQPRDGRMRGSGPPGTAEARIVLTDHDRLVVTRDVRDGTVCVLRPAGADPREILRVARLVLPETAYQLLAEHLGVAATESAE